MMDYLSEAKKHFECANQDEQTSNADVGVIAALIAIAEELRDIHEIMQYSDANDKRLAEERAAASLPYNLDDEPF
jgi:hypothetical protein